MHTVCDGAGAVMLEPSDEGMGILDSIIRSDGIGQNHLFQKAGGSRYPPTHETVENAGITFIRMGHPFLNLRFKNMADVSAEIMDRNHLTGGDVAWLVPHQANKRIIEATAHQWGIEADKVMMTS